MITRRTFLQSSAAAAAFAASSGAARADNAPGVTDTEIKIGQTMPYSGPASAYGVIGKAETAYFKMINEQGGVNGRKINLISLDDGYSPPKTVEQTRRLVEQEQVAFIFNSLGTRHAAPRSGNISTTTRCRSSSSRPAPASSAIRSISPGPSAGSPTTRPRRASSRKHILATKPDAKIGVLYQNDELRQGLPDRPEGRPRRRPRRHGGQGSVLRDVGADGRFADRDVAGSGADTFLIAATPKFAAQAIRKTYDLGWNATFAI